MMSPILSTEDLTKRFDGLTAVDGVDLRIPEGRITSVIGPNGAGKTTLFNMLTGALEPTEGRIEFDGTDITGWSPEDIAREGVGRSFQITNVFEGLSVLDNVRVAVQAEAGGGWNFYDHIENKDEYRERALSVLDRVGLVDQADRPAEILSHGDKRALEIGIVLAIEPDLLLLDEPAAGMSQVELDEMLDLVDELSREYTIVLVEHNMDIVMNISDRVTVLHNGQLIADGPPDEIREDQEVQRAYLGGVEQ